MSELRIRGEETTIRIVVDRVIQRTITAIENFTWTPNVDILQKGYLGETGDRLDEIYKSTSFDVGFDPESNEGLILIDTIVTRAQRRVANPPVINITFAAAFPNGQAPTVTILDAKFKDPGLSAGGRDSYVGIKLSGMSQRYKLAGV